MLNRINIRSTIRTLVNAHIILILPPFYWLLVEPVPLILAYFAIPVAIVLLQARKRRSFLVLNNLKLSTLALVCFSGVGIFITCWNLPEWNEGIDIWNLLILPFLIFVFILLFYCFILNDLFLKEFKLTSDERYISIGLVFALCSLALPYFIGWLRHDTLNLDLLLLKRTYEGDVNPLPIYFQFYKAIGGSTTIGPICAVLIVFLFLERNLHYILRGILIFGFFIVLILCESRSSLVACIVGLAIFQLRTHPIVLTFLVASFLFCSILLIGLDLKTGINLYDKLLFEGFGDARSDIIISLFHAMSIEQFFFGFGYESLRVSNFELNHAHNLFLSVYFDQGFLGLCILLWFLVSLVSVQGRCGFRYGDCPMRLSLFAVFLTCVFFDTSLFRSSFAFLSVFLTVFLIVCHRGRGMLAGRS